MSIYVRMWDGLYGKRWARIMAAKVWRYVTPGDEACVRASLEHHRKLRAAARLWHRMTA